MRDCLISYHSAKRPALSIAAARLYGAGEVGGAVGHSPDDLNVTVRLFLSGRYFRYGFRKEDLPSLQAQRRRKCRQ